MQKINKYLAVVVGVVMLGNALQAAVVNVDFQPGGAGSTYSVDYVGQGAVSDPGNNTWNIVAPSAPAGGGDESGGFFGTGISGQALVNSDGSASGMTLSTPDGVAIAISTNHGGYADIATNAVGLMSDYLQMDSDGFSRSVFVEGLTVGQEYELYLYGAGPWNRDTTFAVRVDNGTGMDFAGAQYIGEATTDALTGAHSLTEGADYVKFTFTAEKNTLWVEYKGDSDGDNLAPFNGLQLVAVLPPEPTFKLFFYK